MAVHTLTPIQYVSFGGKQVKFGNAFLVFGSPGEEEEGPFKTIDAFSYEIASSSSSVSKTFRADDKLLFFIVYDDSAPAGPPSIPGCTLTFVDSLACNGREAPGTVDGPGTIELYFGTVDTPGTHTISVPGALSNRCEWQLLGFQFVDTMSVIDSGSGNPLELGPYSDPGAAEEIVWTFVYAGVNFIVPGIDRALSNDPSEYPLSYSNDVADPDVVFAGFVVQLRPEENP